jgi:hypothetical protein
MKLQNSGALTNIVKCNVNKLKYGKQRGPFIAWANDVFRIICNTVGGFDRPWALLTKLLRYTLVAPEKQNNTASTYGTAMGSFVHAVRHGQMVDPVQKTEGMYAMLQNSIVNVDAVEKVYIKAAQGDSELNATQAHQCLIRG